MNRVGGPNEAKEWVVSGDVLASHLDGETVLLDLESKKYFRLNETGGVIWKGVEKGLSEEEVARGLTSVFDLEEREALQAVRAHLEDLAERGLVQRATSDEDALA